MRRGGGGGGSAARMSEPVAMSTASRHKGCTKWERRGERRGLSCGGQLGMGRARRNVEHSYGLGAMRRALSGYIHIYVDSFFIYLHSSTSLVQAQAQQRLPAARALGAWPREAARCRSTLRCPSERGSVSVPCPPARRRQRHEDTMWAGVKYAQQPCEPRAQAVRVDAGSLAGQLCA